MSTAISALRLDELVEPDRVHRRVYVDQDIFATEMQRVFGQTWVYLAHESQVPEPNDFQTGYLGLRPIIVTRDSGGELHALFNRCTHRAATVCREESGRAKSFQCPYHGWTFRNNGELVGVPWPDAYGPDFRRADLSLGRVPRLQSYRGFIFGTLNPHAPMLEEHLGAARPLLDYWIDRAPGADVRVRSAAHRMAYRGNWKLAYDNAADGYHPAFSHRSLLKMAERLGESRDMTYFGRSPDEGAMYVQYLGRGHTFIDQRPNYQGQGDIWRNQRHQPGREAFERLIRERYPAEADRYLDLCCGAQMNLNIFPNLLIIGNQVQVIEPLAVDRTQLTWHATTIGGVPDEVNIMRMRTQEDFPAFGEPDDQANFEEAQRGLGVAEVEWVQMNRGYGIPERQKTDADGVVTAPVTDEVHMRSYFQEWLRLMTTEDPR